MYNALIRAIDIKESYSEVFTICSNLWICRDVLHYQQPRLLQRLGAESWLAGYLDDLDKGVILLRQDGGIAFCSLRANRLLQIDGDLTGRSCRSLLKALSFGRASERSASRIVGLLTSRRRASSRSDGSRSPGGSSPSLTILRMLETVSSKTLTDLTGRSSEETRSWAGSPVSTSTSSSVMALREAVGLVGLRACDERVVVELAARRRRRRTMVSNTSGRA